MEDRRDKLGRPVPTGFAATNAKVHSARVINRIRMLWRGVVTHGRLVQPTADEIRIIVRKAFKVSLSRVTVRNIATGVCYADVGIPPCPPRPKRGRIKGNNRGTQAPRYKATKNLTPAESGATVVPEESHG